MNDLVTVVRQSCALLDVQLITGIVGMGVFLSVLWGYRRCLASYSTRVARLYSALFDAMLISTAIAIVICSLALILGIWAISGTMGFQAHRLVDLLWIVSQYCALIDVMTIGGFMITVVAILGSIVGLWGLWFIRPLWRTSHE